jgi:hypothetical protein
VERWTALNITHGRDTIKEERGYMSNNELQDLKQKLINLKEKNLELIQQNVLPIRDSKKQEFLNAFEGFFRERGFVIRKRNDSVMASYDTLHFKAFSNESGELLIMKGKEQIACISIHYIGELVQQVIFGQRNKPEDSVYQLEKEIEKEEILSINLEKPEFYYTGTNSEIHFDTPLTILDSIFQE